MTLDEERKLVFDRALDLLKLRPTAVNQTNVTVATVCALRSWKKIKKEITRHPLEALAAEAPNE